MSRWNDERWATVLPALARAAVSNSTAATLTGRTQSMSASRSLAFVVALLSLAQQVLADGAIGISNYRPSQFVEAAASPFFYSVGKQLKYGTSIDESAPALFEGSWLNGDLARVYPSPDNQKAAIVSNRKLYLAQVGKPPLLLLENVDHYAPKTLGDGEAYFKWPTIQWNPTSQFIYVVKDKKQKLLSEQSFSKDGVLVRIDTEDAGKSEELITDFRSLTYFFVGSSKVCFNYAPGDGSVIWKCSTANGVSRARSLDSDGIHLDNGVVMSEPRFLSYQPNAYESAIWMARYGFSVRRISEWQDGLFHKDSLGAPLLTLNATANIKGHRVNGIRQTGGSVLPGGRYVLLNMTGSAATSQVLLDRVSGRYRELPKDTRVYRNLNSTHYENFAFSVDNGPGNRFEPDARVLP